MPDASLGARPATGAEGTGEPRVLMFSVRNALVHKYEVAQLEFEDVIRQVDGADLLAPSFLPTGSREALAIRAQDAARRALGLRKTWPVAPMTVDRDYDLFFAVFHFPTHLAYLDRIKGWRQRCRKAVCFIVEMWSRQIPEYRRYLRLLEQFDHVFVFNARTVDEVASLSGRPCSFLPTATDVLRFTPMPDPPRRDIDVLSIGRGSATAHRQLLELAERRERTYVYDTVNHAVPDYRAHRLLTATLMQRSRFFLAYRINDDRGRFGTTGGEEALPTRYFEGAAGGAVMLGSHTDVPEWRECFGWDDAVIPLPWENGDVGRLLTELDAQPERVERVRRHNIVESLRRHDWVHRWGQVLDKAGLPHTPAMHERVARLESLATAAANATTPRLERVS